MRRASGGQYRVRARTSPMPRPECPSAPPSPSVVDPRPSDPAGRGAVRPDAGSRVGVRPFGRPTTPTETAAMHDVANNTPAGGPKAASRRSFLAGALGASALAVPALGLVSAPRAGAVPPKN